MTRRCEPPTEWLTNDDIPYHWVCHKHDDEPSIARFRAQGSPPLTSLYVDEELASEANGWRYLAPCRPDDATERLRLEAEVTRLREMLAQAKLLLELMHPRNKYAAIDAKLVSLYNAVIDKLEAIDA